MKEVVRFRNPALKYLYFFMSKIGFNNNILEKIDSKVCMAMLIVAEWVSKLLRDGSRVVVPGSGRISNFLATSDPTFFDLKNCNLPVQNKRSNSLLFILLIPK